jgi:protein-disulfide isomerase
MNNTFDRVIAVALAAAALAVAGVAVRRELSGGPRASRSLTAAPPVRIPEWESVLEVGIRVGRPEARVQIAEFGDFECPACRDYQPLLSSVASRFGDSVALIFVHYPLQQHRFAIPAARAAECAARVSRFSPMRDALFAKQDSFGLRAWRAFAQDAGIGDTTAFDACVVATQPIHRIEAGKALGQKIRVRGTPTILVNGWRFESPPSDAELEKFVQQFLRGSRDSSLPIPR